MAECQLMFKFYMILPPHPQKKKKFPHATIEEYLRTEKGHMNQSLGNTGLIYSKKEI